MATPLDAPTAALYGRFVVCAYDMYKAPNQPDPLRPAPIGIPPGYELSAWINMSDFLLDQETVRFYGIVCSRVDDPGAQVIAIRGTEGSLEWVDDAAAILVPFKPVPGNGRVAFGFDKIYSTMQVIECPPAGTVLPQVEAQGSASPLTATTPAPEPKLTGTFAEQLAQMAARHEARRAAEKADEDDGTVIQASISGNATHGPGTASPPARPARPTIVVGHSLGSALCTLFVMESHSKQLFDVELICTLASPRVGDLEFVDHFNNLGIDSWRIVNTRDLVPKLPLSIPLVLPYAHVNTACAFDSEAFARKSLTCDHDVLTYLHWLDGSVGLATGCMPGVDS